MPDAFMATTTSPGPGVGSGNSRISSFRPPRKTTPRIPPPCGYLVRRFVWSDSQRDGLVTESQGNVPRDGDRVLHALMRGAALQMNLQRPLGRLAHQSVK